MVHWVYQLEKTYIFKPKNMDELLNWHRQQNNKIPGLGLTTRLILERRFLISRFEKYLLILSRFVRCLRRIRFRLKNRMG